MLKITRFTQRICSGQRIIFVTVRNKFTKEQVIQRLMKEQKQCFGALLETASQKRKRLKLEKRGVISRNTSESSVDSELLWAQKHGKFKRIRFIPSFAVPEKVVGLKSTHKQEQVTIEAAKNLFASFEKRTPTLMSNKIPSVKPGVQKRILRRLSIDSGTEASTGSEKTVLMQPEDIIKNINEACLFKAENGNHPDVWHEREIISISRTEREECLAYPSVTRILNATMSDKAKKMLELWIARMIKELGQEGFDKYKSDLLQNGQLLHSAIENTLRKMPVEVPPNLKLCFDSVKGVLNEVENVRAVESQVVHPDLGYRGVVDCVASYQGKVYLIDWKKSDRPKDLLSSTYDAPLQIASYIGALNADKNYPFQIKSGLLVIAYTVGNKPRVHPIDEKKLQHYWKLWLGRLKKYYAMQKT